ncbi:MAG: hypothetical protein PHX43_03830 [Alphaproteobacteria bacterium]|nr:hypothetical protein [Alphaproteobacteria bacterium]
MAKFYGAIGYAFQSETSPGVWEDQITEKNYRGDVILNQQRWQQSEKVNDDLNLDNSVSVVADAYAYSNSGYMRYIVMNGKKWKITSLAINRPRIVLQIGGLYNGG